MPRVSIWSLRTSLVYLGLGFTLGALMLIGKGLGGAAGPGLALAGRLAEVGAALAFAGHVWARLTRSGLSEM